MLEPVDTKPKVVFAGLDDAVRASKCPPSTTGEASQRAFRDGGGARGAGRPGRASQAIGDMSAFRRSRGQRIAFKQGGSIEVVPVQRIDYIEAQDDYVHVFARGEKHVKQQTLTELEQVLDATRFVRVHRGYIVNLESLARVEPYAKDSRVVVLKDGSILEAARDTTTEALL